MAEYLIHNGELYDKYGLPKGDVNGKLHETMPWSSVESKIQKSLQRPKFREMNFSVKNICDAMDKISAANFELKPAKNSENISRVPEH